MRLAQVCAQRWSISLVLRVALHTPLTSPPGSAAAEVPGKDCEARCSSAHNNIDYERSHSGFLYRLYVNSSLSFIFFFVMRKGKQSRMAYITGWVWGERGWTLWFTSSRASVVFERGSGRRAKCEERDPSSLGGTLE